MFAMERQNRSSSSLKQRRSGYEPSDTENEWQQESPWHDLKATIADRPKTPGRNNSPLSQNQRYLSNHDFDSSSPIRISKTKTSPIRRRSSKSPYKPRTDSNTTGITAGVSPKRSVSPYQPKRNVSPLPRTERRSRHLSPYKPRKEGDAEESIISSNRKHSYRTPPKRVIVAEGDGLGLQFLEVSKASERSNYSRRSATNPKAREESLVRKLKEDSHFNSPLASELNEMAGEAKLTQGHATDSSMSPGDIFFSRTFAAVQKNPLSKGSSFPPRPTVTTQERSRSNASFNHNTLAAPPGAAMSRPKPTISSASNGHVRSKSSTDASKTSDGSRRSSDSFKKFTANVQKSQKDAWFGCVRKGSCRTTNNSKRSKSPPQTREIDEASYIEKAFVVENLRQFWADKHQPSTLSGFTCHKQQAQLLKQLISHNNLPHILLKGPPGSGKKALTMTLLHEIYGDPAWNISHEMRYFHVKENRPMQVAVPITSSPHHVELNLRSESENATYALMGLVKEISVNHHGIIPEFSIINTKPDFTVIVLYEVDKVEDNVQHLIKWITDCHSDACKIILCCEDDIDILDSVKSRCKVVNVDAPITHEIMEVLIQIARKENFELTMNFAAKIATKSKQNLRKAIMALEACKFHNYPFVDEQPISIGWEEVLEDLATEILADPSPKRLFFVRGKFQKLLVDFVPPKLILQKLVEQFLRGIEAGLKRELYYWHAYYEKRLPMGTSALLKLEEFVAKFMSIYRKSFQGRPYLL